MEEDSRILKQLQHAQIEILDVIDAFCEKNNISYSLYAGTLLGAVRHKDFIPWDDDLDICMPRTDYNRFLALWPNNAPEGYILQNKENSPAFPESFSKIRKDHTTFLQFESERGAYHTGIFVDIFPIDRIPENGFQRKRFYWSCLRYLLYTREYVPPKSTGVSRVLSTVLLKCSTPEERRRKRLRLLSQITKYDNAPSLCTVGIETQASLHHLFPPNLFDHLCKLPFGGKEYPCVANWDIQLRSMYGDYMQLPPEEERHWKHHPLIISFDKNLEEMESL